MTDRASTLIASLGLVPHPEGGHFAEVHRSPARVRPDDGRTARAAMTVIHFLLVSGEMSRLHRVASDESWHFHEGDPLELIVAAADLAHVETARLGVFAEATRPVRVVPAGAWQAARTTGAYSLVSCSVGPGFTFEDFELLRDRAGALRDAALRDPALRPFV